MMKIKIIMKAKSIPGVPKQIKGGFHDTETRKDCNDPEITIQQFAILKERFFCVNEWINFCGEGFADFKLYDSQGNFKNDTLQPKDFIRIDIPGPGNFEAKGFDWVEIISIEKQKYDDILESYVMTCRPSKDPFNKANSHIAHFYSSKSTSTFIIYRGENFIKAGIYGRNEMPNFNAGFLDKVRNYFISIGGMMGISKIQWKRLTEGLLDF